MKKAELNRMMKTIKTGRTTECVGCLAREITMLFPDCEWFFEEAVLKLLDHSDPDVQLPACLALLISENLSKSGIEKLKKYTSNPQNAIVLKKIADRFDITPD